MSADIILTWTLQTGVAITLLTGFVLLIRRPFARRFGAGAAYTLWALPLIRLFMPVIPLPFLPVQSVSLVPSGPYSGSVFVESLPVNILHGPTSQSEAFFNIAALLIGLWLGGAVLWLMLQLFRQRRFVKRMQQESEPLSGRAVWAAKRASDQLGFARIPHIRRSHGEDGPLVTGLFQPLIILPHDFEANFSSEQQHFALLHEMGHIKRRDLWAAFAVLLFRAVNWPNPLVHFAAQKFRADQEAACDAFVLNAVDNKTSDRQMYAETLVQSARRASRAYIPAPIGLTIYHPLKERLMMMKNTPEKTTLTSRLGAGALLLSAALLTAPITLATPLPGTPQTPTPMAGGSSTKSQSKQVIKWEKDDDGVKTEKHYEIIIEDGETKAYSISKDGKRTEIDPKDIEGQHGHRRMKIKNKHHGDGNVEVIVMGDGSGEDIEKRIRVITKGIKGGQHPHQKHVVIRTDEDGNTEKDVQVFRYSSSDTMSFTFDQDGKPMDEAFRAKTMVSAASGLLNESEVMSAKGISEKARRKIEKARKALIEAEEALAAEK